MLKIPFYDFQKIQVFGHKFYGKRCEKCSEEKSEYQVKKLGLVCGKAVTYEKKLFRDFVRCCWSLEE